MLRFYATLLCLFVGTFLQSFSQQQASDNLRRETEEALRSIGGAVSQAEGRWRQQFVGKVKTAGGQPLSELDLLRDVRRAQQAADLSQLNQVWSEFQAQRIGATELGRQLDQFFEEAVIARWSMELAEARMATALIQARLNEEGGKPPGSQNTAISSESGAQLDAIAGRLDSTRHALTELTKSRAERARAAKRQQAPERLSELIETQFESGGGKTEGSESSFDVFLRSASLLVPPSLQAGKASSLSLKDRVAALAAKRVLSEKVPLRFLPREPFPKAIWAVVDMSLDNLPDWVSPEDRKELSREIDDRPTERYLVVVGHGLPNSAAIQSSDPRLDYEVLERSAGAPAVKPLENSYSKLWQLGWRAATLRMGGDEEFTSELRGAIVRVSLKPGVLRSIKHFTWDGIPGSWPLVHNSAQVSVAFVRPNVDFRDPSAHEVSDTFYLPDQFVIEVRTSEDTGLAEIPVAVLRNGQPIPFGGDPGVLQAMRVNSLLYRSKPIHTRRLSDAPRSLQNAYSAGFGQGDTNIAVVPKSVGFKRSAGAQARIWLTPSDVSASWKDALKIAADNAGAEIHTNWAGVTAEVADKFRRFSAFDLWLVTQEATNQKLILWRRARGQPQFASTTQPVRVTAVTVGDHAAMILMRRMFIEMLREHIADWERLQAPEMATAAREFIRALPRGHPVADAEFQTSTITRSLRDHLRIYADLPLEDVKPPAGPITQRSFDWADEQERRKELKRRIYAAIHWHLQTPRESLKRAEEVEETDIEGLLKLTGFGFSKIEERLTPRLMTLSAANGLALPAWAVEIQGREHVQRLAYVAQLYKANAKLAEADTQLALCVASLTPFGAAAGVARARIGFALLATDAIQTGREFTQAYQSWREYEFAEGAIAVLDGERLNRAAIERPGSLGLFVSAMAAFAGFAFDFEDALTVVRAGLPGRVPALARKVQALAAAPDPAAAFRRLNVEERADFVAAAAKAAAKRAAGSQLTDSESLLVRLASELSEGGTYVGSGRPSLTPASGTVPLSALPPVVQPANGVQHFISQHIPPPPELPRLGDWIDTPRGRVRLTHCIANHSSFCGVYLVSDAAGTLLEDRVLKIVKRVEGRDPKDILNRTLLGARTLSEEGIPHVRVREADVLPDGPWPCFFQDRVVLEPGRVELHRRGVGLLPEGQQRAVLQLYKDLASKRVIWYDGHIENVCFFRQADGTWQAQVLDSDFLHRIHEPPDSPILLDRLSIIENFPAFKNIGIRSMIGAEARRLAAAAENMPLRLYANHPEVFMEKMLEHKSWIRYSADGPDTPPSFLSTHLDMNIVNEYFPDLQNHVRFGAQPSPPHNTGPPVNPPPPGSPPPADPPPPPPSSSGGKTPPVRPRADRPEISMDDSLNAALREIGGKDPERLLAATLRRAGSMIPRRKLHPHFKTSKESTSLGELIADNYARTQPRALVPPLHVTNDETLLKIIDSGVLKHDTTDASWSYRGTLREGNIAIRVRNGGEGSVTFVDTVNKAGLVPQFWKKGVRQGRSAPDVPIAHLEFYNYEKDLWIPLEDFEATIPPRADWVPRR